MASKDTRRLNPGVQVRDLVPTEHRVRLVAPTSAPTYTQDTLLACPVTEQGAQPTFAFALNTSGSLVLLTSA